MDSNKLTKEQIASVDHIIDLTDTDNFTLYSREVEFAATEYENNSLSPFFKNLTEYVDRGNIQFDCPGHQGGAYFRKHPAGRQFYDFFGENLFRTDLCNADVDLGDLLIQEGPATSSSKICC